MRKNILRAAAGLLVATLLSTCVVSGTFAKFVTRAKVNDASVTVTKWAITPDKKVSGNLSYEVTPVLLGKDTYLVPGDDKHYTYTLKNEGNIAAYVAISPSTNEGIETNQCLTATRKYTIYNIGGTETTSVDIDAPNADLSDIELASGCSLVIEYAVKWTEQNEDYSYGENEIGPNEDAMVSQAFGGKTIKLGGMTITVTQKVTQKEGE